MLSQSEAASSHSTPRAPEGLNADEDRAVRVFISSTFIDMQAERDALVRRTFPALRARFRARGVELLEVDLRWGVRQEEVENGKTASICLAEIDRCRPYFIGLLGERYGEMLTPDALHDDAIAAFPVLAEAAGRSLTEIEILHGVLRNLEMASRAFFFERDPAWLDSLTIEERAGYVADNDEARSKLADLKARIRASGATIVRYARPEDIGASVEAVLGAALEARFPEADAPDAFTQATRLHAAYARERRELHVGANDYLVALDVWAADPSAPPMLITGASGSGKSALIANWLHAWRAAHVHDIVIEHHLGASAESADPMLLMARLWEQLNRDTGEVVEFPFGKGDLLEFANGLTQRLIQASSFAKRMGINILIALDGLDKLASDQDLRWFPRVLPPRVKLVTSSLDGKARKAALARSWTLLEIKSLDEVGRRTFVAATLERMSKKLSDQRIERVLAHPLAGMPLFLRTLLEELRFSATNDLLDQRLDFYLAARDMPDLFARLLERLEGDCDRGLVTEATSLIWASRAGLEELEIIEMTGATRLSWATMYNGLGASLRDQAGRVAFGHDYLNQAVVTRYLASDVDKRTVHLAIADRFEKRPAAERQAEELPYQLRAAAELGEDAAWTRLEALLLDLGRLEMLRAPGDLQLMSYWRSLKAVGRDPEMLLCDAFEARANRAENWSEHDVDLAFTVANLLDLTGFYGPARERLQERLVVASERMFGPDHPKVARSLNYMASLLWGTLRSAEAEPLYRRALAIDEANFGPDDPRVAIRLNNLAVLLSGNKHYAKAERLCRRALAIDEASFGPEHPSVASRLNNLASLLHATKRHAKAMPLLRRALAITEASFGPDHPRVARTIGNLGAMLCDIERYSEAEPLFRRALAIDEAAFGPDHPNLVLHLNNLATVLRVTNRASEALSLTGRAAAINVARWRNLDSR